MSHFVVSALLAINVTALIFGLAQTQDHGKTFRYVYLVAPGWFVGYYIVAPVLKFLFKERL